MQSVALRSTFSGSTSAFATPKTSHAAPKRGNLQVGRHRPPPGLAPAARGGARGSAGARVGREHCGSPVAFAARR
jgi:hypothetical protein